MEYLSRLFQVNEDNVIEILEDQGCKCLDHQEVFSRVANTRKGKEYIISNFDRIIDEVSNLDNFVFLCYRTFIHDRDFIKAISHHRRLDVRGSFMVSVTDCEKSKLRDYYPNITEDLVSRNESGEIIEVMKEEIASTITANILDCVYDKELFQTLKEFIFNHYQSNNLLYKIHAIDSENDTNDLFHVYEEISSDNERLYKTSAGYQLEFLYSCRELVPAYYQIMLDKLLNLFKSRRSIIEEIYANNLGNDFRNLINKYSSISEVQIIEPGEIGTVCWTFIAGDFLIKYISASHSVYGPDYSCPRCFLINKPYNEITSHNDEGYFLGKLEVQARLFEPLREDQLDILELFEKELAKLGFFCDDLMPHDGKYNIYRLRDYHDADTDDPESLPDWFKENPFVLVDRDCVYPIEKREEVKRKHEEAEKFLRSLKNRI